jgi:hypothetical protein
MYIFSRIVPIFSDARYRQEQTLRDRQAPIDLAHFQEAYDLQDEEVKKMEEVAL